MAREAERPTMASTATATSPMPPTEHPEVLAWVQETIAHCAPDRVHWCDGSEAERQALTAQAVERGILLPLDQDKLPGCSYHRSDPRDVARVEKCTYICAATAAAVGPTNNWEDPARMHAHLHGLTLGGMKGRTLYVVPYLMGVPGSPLARVGVELTDSLYVALSMRIMTRMGAVAWRALGKSGPFCRGLHCTLDLDPAKRLIVHFPERMEIISTASDYGGNVLLSKKCHALRLASWLARDQGWLAEHMMIAGIESPAGEKTFIGAAFPSACGKTNLAMLVPPERFKGWKVTTVGDDIAWLRIGEDGRLWAMNPENGYFGVAPGTNSHTNPNAMATIARDTVYTNVALTHDLDVWWEGKEGPTPQECDDWLGRPWTPRSHERAAHPNSRFTAPMRNNPALAPEVDDPRGVPIDAIIFGGRRATTYPLVFQAFNWAHGVYLGATMGSEMTAAAAGHVGEVRRDPMAMLPFCGYDMGDYFAHWLEMGKKLARPPRVFHVNWFRKDGKGRFLWPGFCENIRVLQWIVDRCRGHAEGQETAIGWMPALTGIDLHGLERQVTSERLAEVQAIHPHEWRRELELQQQLFTKLGSRLPRELALERELLERRLQ